MKPHTHAGGVVFRTDSSGTRYLVVTAKRNPRHWVFPKGHIEPGEAPDEAARREVREEAGVDGQIVGPLGTQSFEGPTGPVRVAYFLMRYVGDAGAQERRSTQWCTFDEAHERLTFRDAREILRVARSQASGRDA